MRVSLSNRPPSFGSLVRCALTCVTVAIAITAVRSYLAVEWVVDGRPWWSHVGRSILKWAWLTFVLLRAIHAIHDWFEARPRQIRHWLVEATDRVAVTCAAGLPRFVLVDPLGGAAFCLWFGAILLTADGFLQFHSFYGPRARQAFWAIAFVTLVPWGLPFVPTMWPG